MALGSTQPLTEMNIRNLPRGKGRPARKADLTALCEPIVYNMWEPRRPVHRDSFALYPLYAPGYVMPCACNRTEGKFCVCLNFADQSGRPRGLRHEPCSPAQTLRLWVRIPLETWMSVCVYSVFVLSCAGKGLIAGWFPAEGALPTVYMIKKL
jgi:hypothetical protein